MGENEIADIVSVWTKIPVKQLTEGESERLKNLEKLLHQRVIGRTRLWRLWLRQSAGAVSD